MRYNFLLITMLSLVTAVSAQQMYRWTDANGKVHYTDDPALAVKEQAKSVEKPTAQTVSSSTTITAEQQAERQQQERDQAHQQAFMAAKEAERQKKCKEMNNELVMLNRDKPRIIGGVNPDGSQHILNDQELAEFLNKKKNDYNKFCSY